MKNYKIRVENGAESKEAQELFFELGCSWNGNKKIQELSYPVNDSYWLCTKTGMGLFNCIKWGTGHDSGKLITIPELRDLVVLKRNDVKDKTHKCDTTNSDYFVTSDNTVYFFDDEKTNAWKKSNYDLSELKPIEKPMKEWLNTETYEYKKSVDMGGHSKWIKIPEGAETAILGSENNIYFWKSHFFTGGIHKNWIDMGLGYDANWYLNKCDGSKLLWQRQTHPEELPFIDDEPSINDQYAEIEKVRQSDKVLKEILGGDLPEFDFEAIDAFIESNVEKSGVEKTLSERQSQYGCFEDVAHVTQGMISLMRQCGYDDMPQPHQMALSMIASKMARIVNGDCNHLDSWHDIGGYSKLIENLIEGK